MFAYGRHLFICVHGDCAGSDAGVGLSLKMQELNRRYGLNKLRNPHRVKCSLVDCLGVCRGGPIVAVYPDGIWYHHVDEAALERIYNEHLLQHRPVEAYIFHRQYPAGAEPDYAPELRGDPPGPAMQESGPVPDAGDSSASETGAIEEVESVPIALEPQGPPRLDAEAADARRAAARRNRRKKGLIIVNTGTGKGKTTAALGVLLRAWGRKMRVGVLQFLKNDGARFGEIRAAERMGQIDWLSAGDGWTWTSKDMDETVARAQAAWAMAQARIVGGEYDLLLLDEFTYPLHYGWLDVQEVVAWLEEHKPPMLHLVITGRHAPPPLIELADLVTEMREIKHPFAQQGIRAQAGIEY